MDVLRPDHRIGVVPTGHDSGMQRSATFIFSLKSTPFQPQPNIRLMADVPDSKSGPRKRVWVQVPPSVLNSVISSRR